MVNHGTTAMCYDTVVPWFTMVNHGVCYGIPWLTMVYHSIHGMVRLHHGIPHGIAMVRPRGITMWLFHGNTSVIGIPWLNMVYRLPMYYHGTTTW